MSIRSPRSKATAPRRRGAADFAVPKAGFRVLSAEEAWELYDAEARALLGISADEFEERWENGDLKARIEEPHVLDVYMVRTPKPSRG